MGSLFSEVSLSCAHFVRIREHFIFLKKCANFGNDNKGCCFLFSQLDYLGYSYSTFELAFGDEFEFSTLFKFPQRGEYEAVRNQVLNLEQVVFF